MIFDRLGVTLIGLEVILNIHNIAKTGAHINGED